MKTIIARFTEMKKAPGEIIEVDGEEVDVNKVETALKSAGIQARNTAGEFRDVDDVLLELSSKWDSLDKMTQRYIATTAAGSRQQSRFIAMMSNYQRTMELMEYATNSAGASQRQFEKTMDSLESKLNRLHDAWEQFTTGIANQSIIKGVVDLLTNLLTTVNNVTDALDPFHTGWSKILAAFLGFKAAKGVVNNVLKGIGNQLGTRNKTGLDEKQGTVDGVKYGKGFWEALRRLSDTQKNKAYIKQKKEEATGAQEVLEKEEATLVRLQQQAVELDKIAAKKREQANAKAAQFGNSSSVAQYANNQAIDAENKALKANSDLKVQNKVVSDAQAGAEMKEAIATDIDTKAKEGQNKTENAGLLTKAKYYAMMLFGSKTTRENARQSLADAGSKFAQAGATGTATGAQWALNAAMMACPVGWILAAIAAIVAAIAIFATIHETTEEKVQRLNKSVKQLGTQMNETQKTINDLTDSWDKLSGLKDNLDDLTIGTVEWKKKLIEVNQEVLNLLDKYPQLAQYVAQSVTGELEISKSGYDQFLESQLESLTRQQQAYSFSQALAADMQQKQYDETKSYRYGEYHDAVQRIAAEGIKRDNFFSTGIGSLATEYAKEQERLGESLSEQEQILISSVSANKKSLKNFEEIKNSTSADIDKYAELSGLTKEQVKKKKEEGELDNDAIKTLIATNKYRKEYEENASKLIELSRKNKLNGLEGRAIAGVNTFTKEDLSGKDINKIFDKYIKDGIVNVGNNEDEVKKILTSQFNFDSTTLNQLLEAGASLDNIVQNLVNSQNSLEIVDKNISKLETKEKEALDDVIRRLESQAGDLSNSNLEKITSIFSNISNQGGDIEAFSKQLNSVISNLKKPEEVKKFLDSLTGVDFSSETKIRGFITGLNDLGISLNDTVQEELIDATNAARDFDMSNVANQLNSINFDLTTDLQDRIKESNKVFTDKEYENYEKELKSHPELLEKFIQVGNERIYTGSLDKLLEVLSNNDTLTNATKRLDKARTEQENRQKKYDVAVKELGYMPNYTESAVANTRIIWGTNDDFDNKFLIDRSGNSLKDKIDLKTEKGKNNNYLNSLLYSYDESGNLIEAAGSEYAQYNGYALNTKKIREIIERAKKDKDFAAAVPTEFYTIIDSVLKKEENDKSFGQWSLQSGLQNVIDDGDLEGFLGDAAKNSKWQSGIVTTNEAFLKKWQEKLGKDILSDNTIDEWKKLTSKEISKKLQSLELSSDDAKTIQNELKTWEPDYIRSLLSAKDIISFSPETEEGLKAQQEAIDALINKHKDYKIELQKIQKELGLTEGAAKKYLAVQYEQREATNSIKTVLSKYKDTLSADNLSLTKNTEDYYTVISLLVDKFKVLFGENITQEWVENNLDAIRELNSSDLSVAQQAMEKLQKTSEATKFTFNTIGTGDANGEIDETIFAKISKSIGQAQKDININTNNLTTDFNTIKSALQELDGSEASISIKANTRAKAMESIKDMMAVIVAQKFAESDSSKIATYDSKLKILQQLAGNLGFSASIASNVGAGYEHGGATMRWDSKNNKWVDIKEDFNAKKMITITDTQGKQISMGTPEAAGTGNTTNSSSKDSNSNSNKKSTKDTTSTWTNDWDRQYAVLKKIESLERERNSLSKEQQRFLKTGLLNEKKILKTKEDQRRNLTQQIKLNEDLVKNADAWLRGMNNDGKFDNAIWWDDKHKTIRTNDTYIRSMDESTKKNFDTIKEEYEHYYSQRNTANSNIDAAIDAIEELTSSISELDFHNTTEKLIAVIDNVIDLYDKAEKRLEWSERNVNSKDIVNLYDAKSKELIEKSKVLTTDFIQTEAVINTLLSKPEYKKYYNYDWKTGKVTTTGAYDVIVDSDVKSNVKDFIDKLNTYSQQRTSDDGERINIQDTLREMEQAILTKAESFRKNVYDAIVDQKEKEISSLENINSSIQSAAADLVNSIQKNIQKIRQERSNKKTEEELTKMQSRLDFLRMDTSSGNQKTILDLEKQLKEKEQSYTDTLIDQKISELQDQNTEAEKQRKQQIEVMKTQLEVQKDNGLIWNDVRYLIANGLSASGKIKEGSELDTALKSWGKYSSLSEQGKKDWLHEQNLGASNFDAYYSQGLNNRDYDQKIDYSASGADKSYDTIKQQMINAYKQGLIESINNTTPYRDYMRYDSKNNKLIQTKLFPHPNDDKTLNSTLQNAWRQAWSTINTIYSLDSYFKTNSGKNIVFTQVPNIARYATGGLADYTGPAWLDGTPSSPELVLNQRDTKNFIQLKDILSSVMNNTPTGTITKGDYYFEINIDVDKITNDYDVDKMVDRIKQQITNSAGYRNVNTINMIR